MATKAASAKPTKTSAETGATQGAEGTDGSGRSASVLKVHHLRPAPGSHKPKTRVGRGEGSKGKTAGRGTKGTKARYQVPERFEGGQMPLHMRLPKLKGFTNRFRTEYQVVNLEWLAAHYPQGGEVSVEDLAAKGAVRKGELVKVLGDGELSVALRVTAHGFSSSAKQKIEAAGGSATTL
ncbi:MAG: large subunit ribosomal protein [Actinomycetota bacterium]|jgi:large subunit ribosomal protein L15|nr:large subunit ribosomal protein [Actinomycetota bacterium]